LTYVPPAEARAASNYAWGGIAFVLITSITWLIIGLTNAPQPSVIFAGLGVVGLVIIVASYLTTADKIRIGDVEGAKLPCVLWGIISLLLGGAAFVFLPLTQVSFFSLLAIVGGIFFLLAHSKIEGVSTASYPSTPPYTEPYGTSGSQPSVIGVTQFCPKCNKEVDVGFDKCPSCGTPLKG
jgi:hypothetical protein